MATLVLIDDELEFVKALDQFFSARGYEVHVALRGSSGLQLVEEHHPDVVLMDLKMPGMDGDEVLIRLRKEHPRVKVVVITAYDEASTKDRLTALGAFAHLEKPLPSMRALADVVRSALQPSA